MKNSEPEYITIIKRSILPENWEFSDEKVTAAFNRLFSHKDALLAWDSLYKLDITSPDEELLTEEDIQSNRWWDSLSKLEKWQTAIAGEFRDFHKFVFLPHSDKLTRIEIKAKATDANKKAKELAILINGSAALLEIKLRDCVEEVEKDAFYYAAEFIRNNRDSFFKSNPKIEPGHYLSIVHHNGMLSNDMRDAFWIFAKRAKDTEGNAPTKAKPRSDNLEARLFAERLCTVFQSNYQQPLIHIASALISAIYDKEYTAYYRLKVPENIAQSSHLKLFQKSHSISLKVATY